MIRQSNLEVESIRAFVRSREVELALAPSQNGADLKLLGSYDGYGEFFSILCFDVDYVCTPGGLELGSLWLEPLHKLSGRFPVLQPLVGNHSGMTLFAEGDDGSNPPERCIVVASEFVLLAGKDWVAQVTA